MDNLICQHCNSLIPEDSAVPATEDSFVCFTCLEEWIHGNV